MWKTIASQLRAEMPSGKQIKCAGNSWTVLQYHCNYVRVIEGESKNESTLVWSYMGNLVKEMLVFVYIRALFNNEDDKYELAYSKIDICFHFKRLSEISFRLYGLGTLRVAMGYFRFLQLEAVSEGFFYSL